ncbi:MAG: hypothetical protein QF903_05905 [Planctomycetota bacterium]|jgi:hypothetical protein|nr:hypothetical protein [Planctomycetota bacterium]MDP6763934.1 hypothetical protein [Planctomycetota bacterium]MDP6988993.1 hypothetical protein [Planctomycetota bacterium]
MQLRALSLLAAAALLPSAVAQTAPKQKPVTPKSASTPPASVTVPAPNPGGYLGGTDTCATPTPIAGQATFPFDTSAASTGAEGQSESLCFAFGTSGIDLDVWFCWTADATGTASMTMCNGASHDTKIAAYPACGCPAAGSALACNDDACGFQSSIQFAVTNQTVYTLQVGSFPGASPGAGSFDLSISTGGGSTGSDSCSTPDAISGDGVFQFDNTSASTGTEGQSESNCFAFGTSGIDADVWFDWTAGCSGTTEYTTCGGAGNDTKIAVYPGSGCPASGSSLACNDDTCGLQSSVSFASTAGSTYTLQLGSFPGGSVGFGTFSLTTTNCGGGGGGPGTALCFGDGSGSACPCGNVGGSDEGCGNSTGAGCSLDGTGSNSIANADLVFEAANALPGQPGLFFQGDNQVNGGNGIVFGDGLRCCGTGVVRLQVVVPDGSGDAATSVDIGAGGNVSAGDDRCYQYWYRNPGSGSPCGSGFNTSNAYSVTWTP